MWLGGLSTGLGTERSLVQFPVRAHAWGCGPGPQLGVCVGQPVDVFLALQCFSPFLPPFPSL